jgi:hypothetical protein
MAYHLLCPTFFSFGLVSKDLFREAPRTPALRPRTAKTKGNVSLRETSGFAKGAQVVEIIGARNWRISPDRLFSMS